MTRELTPFEKKVLRQLLIEMPLGHGRALKMEIVKNSFQDERDMAEKVIEGFAQEPNSPIEIQDGMVYFNSNADLFEWLDKSNMDWLYEEVSKENLRDMVKNLINTNRKMIDKLNEKEEKTKHFRQRIMHWKIASFLITFVSFIVGFLTGFGFV